jgi:hypothetical protein
MRFLLNGLSLLALAALTVAIPVPHPTNSSLNPNGWVGVPCNPSGSCPFSSCTICGNYCGPGWCESTCESEDVCQFSVPPQANSCTDACCMNHDNCCGYNLSPDCNKNLISCLNACPWAADCSGPDGWWHSATIEAAFVPLCASPLARCSPPLVSIDPHAAATPWATVVERRAKGFNCMCRNATAPCPHRHFTATSSTTTARLPLRCAVLWAPAAFAARCSCPSTQAIQDEMRARLIGHERAAQREVPPPPGRVNRPNSLNT